MLFSEPLKGTHAIASTRGETGRAMNRALTAVSKLLSVVYSTLQDKVLHRLGFGVFFPIGF